MALGYIKIAPPFRWPSALEELVKDGNYFINIAVKINKVAGKEEKDLSKSAEGTKNNFYTGQKIKMARIAHKYFRLLEYIEKGSAPLNERTDTGRYIERYCNHVIHYEEMFLKYMTAATQGMIFLGSDTIKLCSDLKLPLKIDSNEDFLEKYLGKVKSYWTGIQKIGEEDKEKVELAKHFNRVTEFIERNCFSDDNSLYFDAQKDEWVRDRSPFHYGRPLHEEH